MSTWTAFQTLERSCLHKLQSVTWWAVHLYDLPWRVENNLTSLRVQKLLAKHDAQNLVYIFFRQKYWRSGLKRLSSERKIRMLHMTEHLVNLSVSSQLWQNQTYISLLIRFKFGCTISNKRRAWIEKIEQTGQLAACMALFCLETLSCTKKSYAESICIVLCHLQVSWFSP